MRWLWLAVILALGVWALALLALWIAVRPVDRAPPDKAPLVGEGIDGS